MVALYPLQDTFVRGELSPRLHARASLDLYRAGLSTCENFLTLPHGGLRKRGGGYYVGELGPSAFGPGVEGLIRLIPFIFSADQAYCMEFGELYLRLYAYGARVGTIELTTPWPEDDLDGIQFVQSADEMWLVHPDYPPQKLIREAALTWTLEEFEFNDGPYKDINLTATTLTPASTGSLTPIMTNNTTPSGTVADSAASANAYLLFDGDRSGQYNVGTASGWTRYTFASGTKVADAYWIVAPVTGDLQGAPSEWAIEGYDGSDWVVLDSRSGETGWSPGEKRFYEFNNKVAYAAYRFRWHALNGITTLVIAELRLNEAGDGQTPFNLTASAVTGINDGAGFRTADVGRSIRLLGSDSKWRWARIVSRTSSTVVTIRLYGHALPDTSPITNWRMSAFEDGDWPSSVGLYEERLALAQRFQLFTSKTGLFDEFAPGEEDDAAIAFKNAGGGQANDIVWIADADGFMLIATAGGVRALSGAGIDEALTPSSFKNRKSRTYGCASMPPIDAGSSFVYASRSRRQLIELTQTQLGRFQSDDIGQVSEHIPKRGIVELTYQSDPDPIIWFPLDTGELAGYTHQPSQEVRGMHRHVWGGSFSTGDAVVERALVTPGQSAPDDLWVAVKRTISAATIRHLEYVQPAIEYADLANAFYVDSGLTYAGAATNSITGLLHLAGQSVDVLYRTGAGKWFVAKGRTVSGAGAITLPNAATCTRAHIGLPYTATAVTLELDVGARDGSLVGRRKKVSKVILSVLETDVSGLEVKSNIRGEWETARVPEDAISTDGSIILHTGDIVIPIDDSWAGKGMIQIRHTNPTPCTIRSFTPVFEGEP